MRILMIVAVDSKSGMGREGKVPWNIPGDRAFFRKTTIGHPILVGRRTFESWGGMPLFNRPCAVWTRSPKNFEGWRSSEPLMASDDLNELLKWCEKYGEEVYVCGGRSVFTALADQTTEIIVSRIPGDYGCDVKFPDILADFNLEATEMYPGYRVERYVSKKCC